MMETITSKNLIDISSELSDISATLEKAIEVSNNLFWDYFGYREEVHVRDNGVQLLNGYESARLYNGIVNDYVNHAMETTFALMENIDLLIAECNKRRSGQFQIERIGENMECMAIKENTIQKDSSYTESEELSQREQAIKRFVELAKTADAREIMCAIATMTGDFCSMRLSDIDIYPCFEKHPPKKKKMKRKKQYFEKTGEFQSDIVIDFIGDNFYLIDGYTTFLLAEQNSMEFVPVRFRIRQSIRAYHRPGGKQYEWELPQKLIDRVSVGDKVLVHTKFGVQTVTVASVERYRQKNQTQKLRKVIKVRSRGGNTNAKITTD